MAPHWRQAARERYEEAAWLGFRLAELLPLDAAEQQQMLELIDPLERLVATARHPAALPETLTYADTTLALHLQRRHSMA